jgi:N-acetyl-1-D-myo-inositol-2-amino-2-deoxy-alpha-D-glucopyranoside deacetylase
VTEQRIRLLAVFAHPDDDVYTIGGTWVLHRDRLDVTLVFCTSGDAGPIWVEGIATRETLGPVREAEQAASMAALEVTGDSRFLRHADHHLPEVSLEELAGEIEEILREVRPLVLVTFGPEGMTSHHDHIRAGEAADLAFNRVRTNDAGHDAFRRLLHVALPRSGVDRFYEGLRSLGDATYGPEGDLFNLTAVADEEIDVAVDTRQVRETKLAGIEAHRTQIGELERVPEPLRWIHLDTEWFVQVWPRDVTRDAMLADPFAGLL